MNRAFQSAVYVLVGVPVLGTMQACVVGDFDAEDLRCPCVEGFVCDEVADRCVRPFTMLDGGPDSGPSDGDVDSGFPDAEVDPIADTTCSSTAGAAALFCNGFEALDLEGWNGINVNTGPRGQPTSVGRQSDVVFRGQGALRSSLGLGGLRAAVFADVLTSTVPELWARGLLLLSHRFIE